MLHTGSQTRGFLPQGPCLGFRTRSKSRPSKGQRDTWPEVLILAYGRISASGGNLCPLPMKQPCGIVPGRAFLFHVQIRVCKHTLQISRPSLPTPSYLPPLLPMPAPRKHCLSV